VNFGAVAALLKISAYLKNWQSGPKPVPCSVSPGGNERQGVSTDGYVKANAEMVEYGP
jgi:hypothetical protein